MNTPEEPLDRARIHGSTLAFLAATVLLTAAALWVGVSDNPPGIVLLFAAGLTLLLSVAHRWRDPRRFWRLFWGCVVGFVLFVVIHNFSEVGAQRIAHLTILAWALSAISVASFLIALIICPVGAVLGAVGGVVTTALRKAETS